MYWIHLVCTWLVRMVPLPIAQPLLDVLAPIVVWLWPAQRVQAERNLWRVLGPGADPRLVRRLANQVFRNYARYMLELVRLPTFGISHFAREVAVHGWEHFEHAERTGRGIILATGHIGNWDQPGAWLAAQGYQVNVPVERLEPERWNAQVQGIRRAAGLHAIPLESGVRRLLQALKQREILGVLVDRPLDAGGVPVQFFGATTRVPAGAAKLAVKTGATLLAAAAVRDRDRPTIYISPPLSVEPSGDRDRDVQALMQRIVEWLEALIRQYPDQWYMFRDMWPCAPSLPPPAAFRRLTA